MKAYAKGFVEGGAWGWDEMVPNVEPTASLPDHGEAWRLPWQVLEQSEAACSMSCRGRVLPWGLERRLELGAAVAARYRYTNLGSQKQSAYWCAHPLFRFEPGMEIGAPVSGDVAEGHSTKVFLPAGAIDRVRLGWSSGRRIELRWDPELTPQLAIWMCNGDLGGYRQIAVEPATAAPLLEPGASFEWWLEIWAL